MNLEWLMSFERFAQTLNFTTAAAQRRISQPALFKQIQQLSESAGRPLYTRTGRTLVLTSTGMTVAHFAKEMLERVGSLEAQLGNGETERVAFAAGQGAFLYLLGPALKRFCGKHVGKIDLVTVSQAQALEHVRNGRAHLAVTVLQSIPKDLVTFHLQRILPSLVVPKSHRLAKKRKIKLDDLDGLELILPPEPSRMRSDLSAVLRAQGIEPNVVVEATGWELMTHFTALGLGASIVNGLCPIPRSLVAIAIEGLPAAEYFLMHRKDQHFFPTLTLLKEAILKEAR